MCTFLELQRPHRPHRGSDPLLFRNRGQSQIKLVRFIPFDSLARALTTACRVLKYVRNSVGETDVPD